MYKTAENSLKAHLLFIQNIENNAVSELSDKDVVLASIKNKEFYVHLVDRYEKKLRRYISRITNYSSNDLDDILQEVFIKTYKNLDKYSLDAKFSSWIYRIAHNEVITFFRKSTVRRAIYNFNLEAIAFKASKESFNLEEKIDKKMQTEIILQTIMRMDEKYRKVLLLRYVEGKKYIEISEILQKPQGTIATSLKQAKEKFKQEILKSNIEV